MKRSCLALLLLLLPAVARAHDFWIEPSAFRPAPGEKVAVRLLFGDQAPGEPVARDPRRIERFDATGPDGAVAVAGVDGADPAGWLVPEKPGSYVIAYDNTPLAAELEGPQFEQYLKEEGLERISALRAGRGQTAARSREIYSRCAKALLAVPGRDGGTSAGQGSGHERILGLRLELVPEGDPFTMDAGGELQVRLLYEGAPLEGALVVAVPREVSGDVSGRKAAARSDAAGRVALRLDRPGSWMIKAVHMVPAPAESGADWESLWASLTFEIPDGRSGPQ